MIFNFDQIPWGGLFWVENLPYKISDRPLGEGDKGTQSRIIFWERKRGF